MEENKPQELKQKNFKDLLKKYAINTKTIGTLIKGIIVNQIHYNKKEYFLVDVKMKSEGLVPVEELKNKKNIGDEIEIIVSEIKNDGTIILSHTRVLKEKIILELKQKMNACEPVKVSVVSKNNSGYRVDIKGGIQGTLFVKNKEELAIGSEVEAYIYKTPSFGSVHLCIEKMSQSLEKGKIVDCLVKDVQDCFLLVNIVDTRLEGYIHSNDISWKKNLLPRDFCSSGDKIKAQVLSSSSSSSNLILGIKQMSENLWSTVEEKYKVGDVVEVRVIKVENYGLSVELESGLHGRIDASEVSWSAIHRKLNTIYSIKQLVKAKIQTIDKSKFKINLSIKELEEDPLKDFLTKFKKDDIVEGIIIAKVDSVGCAFVQLVPGLDGLLATHEMHWDEETAKLDFNEKIKEGEKIKVRIIRISEGYRRVILSVKQLTPNKFKNTLEELRNKRHMVYDSVIIDTSKDLPGIQIQIKEFPNSDFFIKRQEFDSWYEESPLKNKGTNLKVKYSHYDNNQKILFFSHQKWQRERKSIENTKTQPSSSNFSNLIDFM